MTKSRRWLLYEVARIAYSSRVVSFPSLRALSRLVPLLALSLVGCETSPEGGACESIRDCDRSGSTEVVECVRAQTSPTTPIRWESCTGTNCVCCPRNPSGQLPRNCPTPPGMTTTDVVVVDATSGDTGANDSSTDAADASTDVPMGSCGTMTCGAGTFCQAARNDAGPSCVPLRPIGQMCGSGTECQTTFCVTGVCCNSACTGSGVSCNADPNFAGLCMRTSTMTPVDAGSDASTGNDASTSDASSD